MSAPLLLGTNNGRIIRRDESGTWALVYTGAITNPILSLVPSPADPQDIWGYHEPSNDTSSATIVFSTDGGLTWSTVAWTPPPHEWPCDRVSKVSARDVDGSLVQIAYVLVSSPSTTPSSGDAGLGISTDLGLTWTFSNPENTGGSVASSAALAPLVGGKLWWLWGADSTSLLELHGIRPDGSGAVSLDTGQPRFNSVSLRGGHIDVPTRLYILDEGDGKVVSVDVSDPDSPAKSTSTQSFVGAHAHVHATFIRPLSDQVALACSDYGFPTTSGSIWKTTDGGASWTEILHSANLGHGFGNGPLPSIVVADDAIWALGAFPHLWFSIDAGDSWTEEDVPTTDLGTASRWTAMAPVNAVPVFPGPSGFRVSAALIT